MSWVDLDTESLTADAAHHWSAQPRAAGTGEGAVLRAGPHTALIGPSASVDAWLAEQHGSIGRVVGDLACFVYHRKRWFADELDPLGLRDRRPGQYEMRVFTDAAGMAVPLFAIDFAPVRHRGTFATLVQDAPNHAASLTEIAVVPPDQEVLVGGVPRPLGALACSTDRLWEASRLGSVTELVRLEPTPAERGIEAFGDLGRSLDAFASLDALDRSAAHAAGRALFGVALAWAIARLPVDLIVGLSQGNVVRAFTALVTGGDRYWHPLELRGWHADAPAFHYAPGYFATGEVCGYSLDAGASLDDTLALGLRRLSRLEAGVSPRRTT